MSTNRATPLSVEYRVKEVTRYIVIRHAKYPGMVEGEIEGRTDAKGELENETIAFEVASALCGQEHENLGWPRDDARIQYPRLSQKAVEA